MAGGDRRKRRTEGVVAPPPLGAERRLLSCLFLLGALFGFASAATRTRQDIRCQFISSGCVGNRMVAVVTSDGGETPIGTIFPAAVQGNTVDVAVSNDSLQVVTTASCNATHPERAPLMGFLYPLDFQAQRPKGDGATRFNLSVMSASRVHGATRTENSPQAAPPPPAAANSHHVAADLLYDHLQYSSNNGLEVAAATTTMIAVLIDLADKIKKKRSRRGKGSRPAAVAVAMALVMLLAVAALVNPTAAAPAAMTKQQLLLLLHRR
uniref:Uncharacterized protein n=1 Tax=Oryza glumipatula TaxID=40148 RepID=A0A0E0B230_9ORYZ